MKPLFRCEYCDKIGTAEEITDHETACIYNYDKLSCYTCKHAENMITKFICKAGRDIPEGKIYEHCPSYEWDEKEYATRSASPFNNLFGGIFG